MSDINNSILKITLALTEGAKLSNHIAINVITVLNDKNLSFEETVLVIKKNYPSLPELTREHWDKAQKILDTHLENNISCISILNPDYPYSLKIIKNPPSILYLRGDINILRDLPGIAVVGTREVTNNGSKIAHRLAAFLAENKWTVISGLAIGVDAYAHQGALSVNGKTIAVLASGLHKASPKQNSLLADEILLKGGAWVSEHPWGVEPKREYFVPRNRIQIGLSAGSIIVESEIKSGTATQAEFCLQAQRPLFAVIPQHPNNPLELLSNGPLYLVEKKEAIPIMTKDDYPILLRMINEEKIKLKNNAQTYI